jgi:nitrogenase-associated protein
MSDVIFYEKPGCKNNTKQKALLTAAGHTVEAHSLLTHPWTPDSLRPFFGDRPVAEWFNKAAPKVKNGDLDPTSVSADDALAMMMEDRLLIRRPLIEAKGEKRCGFDPEAINDWIGLGEAAHAGDVETCPNLAKGKPCKHGNE